ncbi:hypothetical protein KIN20_032824 [Parelaphostrongylus tenuis]|uniref:Uncharacterized protein n=1 Tax=Parelaphostrongylus tenuis TaxID=148309 RepID=A0AAD5WIA8_PARTN|nr:hypothetical protein KIN20_032824 [Parelaphostrongylus tenuis]
MADAGNELNARRDMPSRSERWVSEAMFSGRKVKWNHFGKKYSFHISDYEMEYVNLYDALMKKVHEVRPDFEGAIAYIDHLGRQVVINSDKTIRDALNQSKGKLKLHTTLVAGQIVSAAELAGRATRSHSVPPAVNRGYHSYPPAHSRSPSSMESAPASFRNRTASQPGSQTVDLSLQNREPHDRLQVPSPGYGYKYSSHVPYSQSLLYGMPPHNGMLLRFLASPFPFGGYHRDFIGPNKYHHFGTWGGHRYYSSTWGPIW